MSFPAGGDDGRVAANDDPGIEIRRANHTTATAVAVVLAAIVAVVLVRDPSGSFEGDPVTTTIPRSEQSTTSGPGSTTTTTDRGAAATGVHPIRGLAVRNDQLYVLQSRSQSLVSTETEGVTLPDRPEAVATEELVAVIDVDGGLRVGGDRDPFRMVACCFTRVVASNERRQVWAVDDDVAVLVELDSGATSTRLPLDGDRIIGAGPVGLVTVDDQERAMWRRPGAEPGRMTVPSGLVPVSAGGDVVLYLWSGTTRLEARRIDDGALVRAYEAPAPGPVAAAVAADGRSIAVSGGPVTTVFDVDTGATLGRFDSDGSPVVSVGDSRFAAIVGRVVRDSTGRNFPHFAQPLVLATRAE